VCACRWHHKFNHIAESSRFAIPSKVEHGVIPLVPLCGATRRERTGHVALSAIAFGVVLAVPHYPGAQHCEQRGPMTIGARSAAPIERFEYHHGSGFSVVGSRIERRQPSLSFRDSPLLRSDASAKRQVDANAAILVQQVVCSAKRTFSPLYAEPRLGEFKVQYLDHFPKTFRSIVPSKSKPPLAAMVPTYAEEKRALIEEIRLRMAELRVENKPEGPN